MTDTTIDPYNFLPKERPKGARLTPPWSLTQFFDGLLLVVTAALFLGPLLAIFTISLGHSAVFAQIWSKSLSLYLTNSALLLATGGLAALLLGILTAWLVTYFDFFGRGFLSWALILPLGVPAYVAAYAWGDILGSRGLSAAALVYASTLYPYAFLSMRASLTSASVCALEAASLMGAGPVRRFLSIGLPMARRAILAGAALIGLEILADFGAVDHLGVPTLSVGLFRAWSSHGDLVAAARLALILLLAAAVFVLAQYRQSLDKAGKANGGSIRWRTPALITLKGPIGMLAAFFGVLPVLIGLGLPVARLVKLAIAAGPPLRDLAGPALHSFALALSASLIIMGFALSFAMVKRAFRRHGKLVQYGYGAILFGYAMPGAVIGLGVLAMAKLLGLAPFLGGIWGFIFLGAGLITRFAGAALEPIEAGLDRAHFSMRAAAATLGADSLRRFWQVELTLALPSFFAACLIIGVEVIKELPITLLLRPFGFDTLAVRAHGYAADERLGAAAWPALLILLLALVPTIILSISLARSRAGAQGDQ